MTAIGVFLGQALIIVCLPCVLWRGLGLRRFLPLAVVQILLGVALGPSVLGALAPDLWRTLFATAALTPVTGVAWLAVALFAFLTGLHLRPEELKGQGAALLTVSLSSIAVPGALGVVAGYVIALSFPAEMGPAATPGRFAVGVGICAAVTALPVLGAILREMGLLNTRLGRFALGCAAVNDGMLWVLLAALLSSGADAAMVPLLGAVYLGVMTFLVRPALARRFAGRDDLDELGLVVVCATLFGSALAAELVGLHYIVGAFVAGIAMPRPVADAAIERLEPTTVAVLLPFFFILAGLKTSFDLGASPLIEIFLIATAVSMAGKVLGTAVAARGCGEGWGDALTLGALMQTKGLMEVVVLTILLDAGVISATVFTALLLMAVATTALTKPLALWARTCAARKAGARSRP